MFLIIKITLKIKYYIILLILFVFIACNKKIQQDSDILTVKIDVTNESELPLVEIADFERVIPLETTEKCLIGEIKGVFLSDSNIVVWDSKTHNVLVFNDEGNYKYNLGKKGNGPGEYIQIADVNVINDIVYILDLPTKKIMSYDIKGSFIKEDQLYSYMYQIYPDADGYWAVNSWQDEDNHDLIFIDGESKKIKYRFFAGDLNMTALKTNNFSKNEKTNELLYHFQYSDTIYKIKGKSVLPYLAIDFGSKRNTQDVMSKDFIDNFDTKDYVGQIHNVHAYGDKLFFSFNHFHGFGKNIDSYNAYIALDNPSPVIYSTKLKKSDKFKIQPLPDIIGLSQGKLIYQIVPDLLPEELLSNVFGDKTTTDSNPILVLYNLK